MSLAHLRRERAHTASSARGGGGRGAAAALAGSARDVVGALAAELGRPHLAFGAGRSRPAGHRRRAHRSHRRARLRRPVSRTAASWWGRACAQVPTTWTSPQLAAPKGWPAATTRPAPPGSTPVPGAGSTWSRRLPGGARQAAACPRPTHLNSLFGLGARIRRGTATMAIERRRRRTVRRDGVPPVPSGGGPGRSISAAARSRRSTIPWGDAATAYHTKPASRTSRSHAALPTAVRIGLAPGPRGRASRWRPARSRCRRRRVARGAPGPAPRRELGRRDAPTPAEARDECRRPGAHPGCGTPEAYEPPSRDRGRAGGPGAARSAAAWIPDSGARLRRGLRPRVSWNRVNANPIERTWPLICTSSRSGGTGPCSVRIAPRPTASSRFKNVVSWGRGPQSAAGSEDGHLPARHRHVHPLEGHVDEGAVVGSGA